MVTVNPRHGQVNTVVIRGVNSLESVPRCGSSLKYAAPEGVTYRQEYITGMRVGHCIVRGLTVLTEKDWW